MLLPLGIAMIVSGIICGLGLITKVFPESWYIPFLRVPLVSWISGIIFVIATIWFLIIAKSRKK